MKKIAACLIVIGMVNIGHLFAQQAREAAVDIPFAQNFNYVNQAEGFRIDGPKGWYGIMQSYDPHGVAQYAFLPKGTRALYIKYKTEEWKSHPFAPLFEVKLFSNNQYSSSLEALQYYVSKTGTDALLTAPAAVTLGTKEWAACEYKFPAGGKNGSIDLIRKVYLLIHKDSLIVVQATDTAQDYGSDSVLFDEAVSGMKFSDNY